MTPFSHKMQKSQNNKIQKNICALKTGFYGSLLIIGKVKILRILSFSTTISILPAKERKNTVQNHNTYYHGHTSTIADETHRQNRRI